jgi:iron complex transport system substrate-binding protein
MSEKRRNLIGLVFLFAAFTLLSGCRGAANSNTSAQPGVATRIVTDDLGRKVTIPVKIARVVSLAPNLTENIFAVGAGDRLVGVTTFCNYPEQAKEIAKIGDTMTPNMESLIALKPDVVFVSTASQIETFMKTLEANGIAVYVTDPYLLEQVIHNLEQFALMFGTDQKAKPFIDDLQTRSQRLRDFTLQRDETPAEYEKRIQPVPVFVQISKEPLFTIGKASFVTEVIARAGGKSVTANVESAYPKLSKETASALNPEVIILSESDDNLEPNDALKNSPAVKNRRVYKVNADLLSRPGPRLVDALEQIAKYLHSEKFK